MQSQRRQPPLVLLCCLFLGLSVPTLISPAQAQQVFQTRSATIYYEDPADVMPLGMQMMFDGSEEFQGTAGLGLISGKVVGIPPTTADGVPHKIPHIGWNKLLIPVTGAQWDRTILHGIQPGVAVYFVHSYTCVPDRAEDRLADSDYHGRIISAAVRFENLSGCQFHPEKSGAVGLKLLENFLGL